MRLSLLKLFIFIILFTGTTNLVQAQTTVVSPRNGGTGTSSTDTLAGKVLIGNTNNTYTPAYITAGSNITITTSSAGITINSSVGGASTTINAVAGPTFFIATSGASGITISTSSQTLTISQTTSSASSNGFLSSADWSAFNAKESALTFQTPLSRNSNTVYFSGSYPTSGASGLQISSSSGIWTFSQTTSSVSTNGFLSSADWGVFNAKQSALTFPLAAASTTQRWLQTGSFLYASDTSWLVGVGTANPSTTSHVYGSSTITMTTNSGDGFDPKEGVLSVYNPGTKVGTLLQVYNEASNLDNTGAVVDFENLNTGLNQVFVKLRNYATSSQGDIRMDRPNGCPEIEMIGTSTLGTGGAGGKFEVRVCNDGWQVNSRAQDNSTFEKNFKIDSLIKGGRAVFVYPATGATDFPDFNTTSSNARITILGRQASSTASYLGISSDTSGPSGGEGIPLNDIAYFGKNDALSSIDGTTFTVDHTNNRVGIGTTTPATGKLVVDGAGATLMRLNVTGAGNNGYLEFAQAGTIAGYIGISDSGGIFTTAGQDTFGLRAANDFRISIGSSDTKVIMMASTTGNVGIGTINPSSTLHVYGGLTTRAGFAATSTAKVGGSIAFNITNSGNTAGEATTSLHVISVTSSTLITQGDSVEFFSAGTMANNGNSDKRISVTFGTSSIFDTSNTTSQNASWQLRGICIRNSQTSERCHVNYTDSSGIIRASTTNAGFDALVNNSLIITGGGTGASDVVATMTKVWWSPAP